MTVTALKSVANANLAMSDSTPTPAPRRRLTFRCLLVVTCALILFAGGRWWWHSQGIAVQVEHIGGRYEVLNQETNTAERMFQKLVGMQPRGSHEIAFSFSRVDDNWLRDHRHQLAGLEDLGLSLARTGVTDVGLQHLAQLTNITRLDVNHTQVTDEGLGHIATLSSLSMLAVGGTQVTGAGLRQLRSLPQLQYLEIDKSKITGDDLNDLILFPRLNHVMIDATQASERGIAGLRACPNVQALDLEDATDDAVKRLEGWSALRGLSLMGEEVTDASVPPLTTLSGLELLTLFNSSITDDGDQLLHKALPQCLVSRSELK